MGNSESTTSDTHDDSLHQVPSYANSTSYAETPMDSSYQRKQQPSFIADNFNSVDQVISALREAGLESSNLILGIDCTKSNEWTGKYSFNRKSLHAIGNRPNPYEQAISVIGRTLSPFDEDNLIPCFGFGDASTHDQHVFSFYPDHRYCHGFEEALARYREIIPLIKLAGELYLTHHRSYHHYPLKFVDSVEKERLPQLPSSVCFDKEPFYPKEKLQKFSIHSPTSFAPIIYTAIDIVEKSNWQYHVLVIVADGQVTRNSDTPSGRFSPQEQATIDSIVNASNYPLSIVLVGVGDGPWDAMKQFDDNIPHRAFDNFQFVNFTKVMSENNDVSKKEAAFALAALMEIPYQYRYTQSCHYTKNKAGPQARPLPPPREVIDHDNAFKSIPHMTSSESVAEPPMEQACPICLTNPKDMAFGCGHLVCKDCGVTISSCPMCRKPISTRIRLYT